MWDHSLRCCSVTRNPFAFGSPVTGAHFAGRAGECAVVTSAVEQGECVTVTGPAGYGKSSLLLQVAERVRAQGGHAVYVDLLRMSAAPDPSRHLRAPGIDHLGGPVPAASDGPKGDEIARLVEQAHRHLSSTSSTRGPALIVLDGFETTGNADSTLMRLVIELIERRSSVSIVAATASETISAGPTRASQPAPLPHMDAHLQLGPVEEAVMVGFLRSRAKGGGKAMPLGTADLIFQRAGPSPRHLQRLAHAAFEQAEGDIDERAVDSAFDRVVSQEADRFARRISSLAAGHRRVLAALATNAVERPQSAVFVRATGYANPAAARKALRTLVCDEEVIERDGAFHMADPFLSRWLVSRNA